MVWARQLSDLVADVQDRADVAGFTARHPTTTIRRRLVESYHALRDWMTSAGSEQWCGGPYRLLGGNFAYPVEYGVIYCLMSESRGIDGLKNIGLIHLRKVETFWENSWHEVKNVPLGSQYKWSSFTGNQYPLEYVLIGRGNDITLGPSGLQEGSEPVSSSIASPDLAGQLRILVMPTKTIDAYPIQVYGVPALNIVDADTTALSLDESGFEWLILNTALKLVVRDNDSQSLYQILKAELAQCRDDISKSIQREKFTPTQRRDIFESNEYWRYRRGI